MGLLNRALRAAAVAAGDPYLRELTATRATRARIGFGTGDQVADGKFTAALDVDVSEHRRAGRVERIAPQERIAALLGNRTIKDACELPLLRARADVDAGDLREAALQLRVGLEALLVELRGRCPTPATRRTWRFSRSVGARPARQRTPRSRAISAPSTRRTSRTCSSSASASSAAAASSADRLVAVEAATEIQNEQGEFKGAEGLSIFWQSWRGPG